MAETSYEYDVLDDTLDGKIDGGALQEQVEQSAIASASILYVNTGWLGEPAREKCDIWFDDPLTPGDEIILDGVVAAHDGEPIQDTLDLAGPVATQSVALRNDGDVDDDVAVGRDGVGNMVFKDQGTTTKTLTELATAGQPDLSKVVIDMDGAFVVTDDGEIVEVT